MVITKVSLTYSSDEQRAILVSKGALDLLHSFASAGEGIKDNQKLSTMAAKIIVELCKSGIYQASSSNHKGDTRLSIVTNGWLNLFQEWANTHSNKSELPLLTAQALVYLTETGELG